MAVPYVDLQRRFRELTEEQAKEPEAQDLDLEWSWLAERSHKGWSELEARYRTVIIAEAGSGKTREMQERCRLLNASGKFAFFLPLESLEANRIKRLLEIEGDPERFDEWKTSSTATAWFFLDALDELKLREGVFPQALLNLRDEIRGEENRARVVVSCRPSDWHLIDTTQFKKILPPPDIPQDARQTDSDNTSRPRSPDDRFLAPLRGNPQLSTEKSESQYDTRSEAECNQETLEIFWLSPLQNGQIELLVHGIEVKDPVGLMEEIKRSEAWNFARSPQDVIEISAHWEEHGTLGTRSDQYEAHIGSRLRDRGDRPAQDRQLTYQEARNGAERLALAIVLTKKRSIHTLDVGRELDRGTTSLNPVKVLEDWSPSDVGRLLSLGIFDPPTFGRVRFHRQGVEQYLAASRIRHLAEMGLGTKKDVLRLFIATGRTGIPITLESLRPVAAWLALWNSDLRDAIIEIDPQHLISNGDPERIPVESRVKILRRTVESALNSGTRCPSCSPGALRRFADPAQGSIIREAWPAAKNSDDLLGFLLCLIRDGGLGSCSDLAEGVARSTSNRPFRRVLAVQALIGAGDKVRLQKLAEDLHAAPRSWPIEVSDHILDDLCPSFLSVSEALEIIENVCVSEDSGPDGFADSLSAIAQKIEPASLEANVLRVGLTSLIVNHQRQDSTDYHPTSEFAWASNALVTICVRQFATVGDANWKGFFDSCLTAHKFRSDQYYGDGDLKRLHELIKGADLSKAVMYLAELEYICATFNKSLKDGPIVSHETFGANVSEDDWVWLKKIVEDDRSDIRIRHTALLSLLRLWNSTGCPKAWEESLRNLRLNGLALHEQLEAGLKPVEPYPSDGRWKEMQRVREEKEERRIQGWIDWRSDLLSDPHSHFASPKKERTRRLLFDWMMADNSSSSSYRVWHRGIGIQQAFGKEIEALARQEFISYWRDIDYKPFGSRSGEGDGTAYAWLYGLNGVLAEADVDGWESNLSDDDVRQATRLALVEINGIAPYVESLAAAHPRIVAETLNEELSNELRLVDQFQHLPLLQDLTHASKTLKLAVSEILLNFVNEWEGPARGEESKGYCYHHLSQALDILVEISSDLRETELGKAWANQFVKTANSQAGSLWLRALFAVDGATGTSALENALESVKLQSRVDFVVRLFGSVFDPFRGVAIKLGDEAERIGILGRLCKIAYTYILPSEDERHPSGVSYTPNSRDDAQSARSRLLNELIESPDPDAQALIEKLAADPVFESVRDWLKNRARVKEVQNAEPPPLTVEGVRHIERSFERLPVDRDSMFRLMINRLNDLQHDVTHHSFFPRKTAQSIHREEEMQRLLSLLLELGSNNAFCVVREDEVADLKRTDIKLLATGRDACAVIEVKVADKRWSTQDFLRALEAQLQGQYLRHEKCRAGCLLLTYNGAKKYWLHPESKKRLYFPSLISFLNARAEAIAKEKGGGFRIEVVGLDFSDPILPAAHGQTTQHRQRR